MGCDRTIEFRPLDYEAFEGKSLLVLTATQLGTSFTGTGQRFGRSLTDASVTDQFLSAGLAGSYVF